jgi:nucleoporin GLE1
MATRLRSSPSSAKNSPRGRRLEDSPSRQLNWDLERGLSQLKLHENESAKLHAYEKRQQQEDLDAQEAAQAQAHLLELNAAQAQHELVRSQAEAVLHAYLKEEHERRQREEEERRRREEEERRRKAEEEARRRAEEERLAREQQARREREERERQEAERRAKEKAASEERQRQEREAAEQKARDDKAQADREAILEKQQKDSAASKLTPQPLPASTLPAVQLRAPDLDNERRHAEYLALHKKLKPFRKQFWESAKKNPTLKTEMGNMRRGIRSHLSKLTASASKQKEVREGINGEVDKALRIQAPMVPVNDFLPPYLNLGDNNTTQVSAVVIWLFSEFSRSIISSFATECVDSLPQAELLGVLAAHVFSRPDLQFTRVNGTTPQSRQQSLMPILLCKLHAVAPILFGISGPEDTQAGRIRIGWRKEKTDTGADAPKIFIGKERQYDRQYGLAAGFAALSLRNFAKAARLESPFPPTHYWSALAHIVNTPPHEVHMSHLLLLKGLLENSTFERFILFFGAAGIAALKQAVIEFPKTLSSELQRSPAAKGIQLIAEKWKSEKGFSIA